MNLIFVILGLWPVDLASARSLDRARVLANQIERHLDGSSPILCAECDGEWSDGGEPVRRLELVLTGVVADPRALDLKTNEDLGELMVDHLARVLSEINDGVRASRADAKKRFCAFTRKPCQLFSPTLFTEFCLPPEDR